MTEATEGQEDDGAALSRDDDEGGHFSDPQYCDGVGTKPEPAAACGGVRTQEARCRCVAAGTEVRVWEQWGRSLGPGGGDGGRFNSVGVGGCTSC